MTFLYKRSADAYLQWSSGSTSLLTDMNDRGHKLIVSIKCSFGDRPEKHYALFDTGARWSVIPQSIAESYPDCFFSLDTEISQVSRHGKNTGVLHLCNIRFLADDGEDIIFESNVLVIPDWNGPIVIGFTAMLDKIRWACDPTIDHQGRLYFGID